MMGPFVRTIATLSLGLALLSCPALTSRTQAETEIVFQSGDWQGYATYGDVDGSFSHCGILRDTDDWPIGFSVAQNGDLIVILENVSWAPAGEVVSGVTMQVDQSNSPVVSAESMGSALTLMVKRDPAFFDELRRGERLFVRGLEVLTYSLSGAKEALGETIRCLLHRVHTRALDQPTPEDDDRPSATANGPARFDADFLKRMRADLKASGLTNLTIVSDASLAARLDAVPVFAWRADQNISGYLIAGSTDDMGDPRTFTNRLLYGLIRECDGEFTMRTSSVVGSASGFVFHAATTCYGDKTAAHYNIISVLETAIVYAYVHRTSIDDEVQAKVRNVNVRLWDRLVR